MGTPTLEATEAPFRVAEGRIDALKRVALAGPDTPIGFRCWAHCQAAIDHAGEPLVIRRAHALALTLKTFPAIVGPLDVVAGTHLFGEKAGRDSGFDFVEFAPHYYDPPGDALRAGLEHTELTPEQRATVLSCVGRHHELLLGTATAPSPPEEVRAATEAHVLFGGGYCVNHSVRDYGLVVCRGFRALAEEIDTALAACRIEDPDDIQKLVFYRGASAVAHAAEGLGRRYAEVARAEAATCADPARRAELERMAEACERVPAEPARTLFEAVQAIWLAHAITCCEDHINANSIGRLDQILQPYYEADVTAGRMDREGAIQLIELLWLKLYRDYDVQQVVLSGQRPDGTDATNDMTYICLEATRRLGLVRCLSVRLHKGSPRKLLEEATDLLSQGGGIPFFFNDDVIVPALCDKGIPLEDARDYAVIGCVEITIPGRTNPHAVSHNTNLAKCLELALHDGFDPATGRQVGPHTGLLESFGSMREVFEAYKRQVEHFTRIGAFLSNAGEQQQESTFPLPYESILTADCIARGRDITAGGARYNYHSCSAIGIPNVADSLAALDRLVFGTRTIGAEELRRALLADFEGYEPLRQMLLHSAPKYGNDREEVDALAAEVSAHFCETLAGHRARFNGRFHAHLFSFLWHVDPFGRSTGALPDGRKAGQPLAYSLSPTQGRDEQGVTAVLNSLAAIPHDMAAASSSAIIELAPSFFAGEGRNRFVDLLQSAIARGIGQMQFNVVTAERLKLAQEDPENYGNIVVRVSGFSQRFASIGRELQDHIIARVKHEH